MEKDDIFIAFTVYPYVPVAFAAATKLSKIAIHYSEGYTGSPVFVQEITLNCALKKVFMINSGKLYHAYFK